MEQIRHYVPVEKFIDKETELTANQFRPIKPIAIVQSDPFCSPKP